MQIILNKYPSVLFRLDYIYDEQYIIIAPSKKAKKFEDALKSGERVAQIVFLNDYTFPNLVSKIREISETVEIESIFTLCEEYIDWAGYLNDHFVERNSVAVSNVMFKDKFFMRSFLQGIVEQPYFRLLESREDLEKFWNLCNTEVAILKPRRGAACTGIRKVTNDTLLDDSYFMENYIIEEYVDIKKMITCDGYAIGKDIKRFFVHDNVELLLDSLTTKGYYLLRTSELYQDLNLIRCAYLECQNVIKEFSVDGEMPPFHFEWFFDVKRKRVVFCEVGKRFGGGDIPDLIKEAFNVDVLKEYWQIKTSKNNFQGIVYNDDLPKPQKIGATFASYVQSGIVQSLPNTKELSWASRVYVGLKVGDDVQTIGNIIDNSMIVRFISDDEADFSHKIRQVKEANQKIKYKSGSVKRKVDYVE